MEVKDNTVVFAVLFQLFQGISIGSLVEGSHHHLTQAFSMLAGESSLRLISIEANDNLTHRVVVWGVVLQAIYADLERS